MGMFDSIIILDPEIRCDKDHKLSTFQTKDFDCVLLNMIVSKGYLFKPNEVDATTFEFDETELKLTRIRKDTSDIYNITQTVQCYTSCYECVEIEQEAELQKKKCSECGALPGHTYNKFPAISTVFYDLELVVEKGKVTSVKLSKHVDL